MGISQASIFGLTFLTIFVLVLLLKRNRHTEQEVVAYSLGYSEFEEEGHDGRFTLHSVMNPSNGHVSQWLEVSELLHITQTVKKAEEDGNLTVVMKEFHLIMISGESSNPFAFAGSRGISHECKSKCVECFKC